MQLHMHDAISYPHPHPPRGVVEAAHGEETREGRGRGDGGEWGGEGGEVGIDRVAGARVRAEGGFDSHRGVSLLVIIHLSNRSAITI